MIELLSCTCGKYLEVISGNAADIKATITAQGWKVIGNNHAVICPACYAAETAIHARTKRH